MDLLIGPSTLLPLHIPILLYYVFNNTICTKEPTGFLVSFLTLKVLSPTSSFQYPWNLDLNQYTVYFGFLNRRRPRRYFMKKKRGISFYLDLPWGGRRWLEGREVSQYSYTKNVNAVGQTLELHCSIPFLVPYPFLIRSLYDWDCNTTTTRFRSISDGGPTNNALFLFRNKQLRWQMKE